VPIPGRLHGEELFALERAGSCRITRMTTPPERQKEGPLDDKLGPTR
jgi:hypothetical protein